MYNNKCGKELFLFIDTETSGSIEMEVLRLVSSGKSFTYILKYITLNILKAHCVTPYILNTLKKAGFAIYFKYMRTAFNKMFKI